MTARTPVVPPDPATGPERGPRQHAWVWLAALLVTVGGVGAVAVAHTSDPPAHETVAGQGTSLSPNQVARLFDQPQPGLSARHSIPNATGTRAADKRIAAVATSRGYRRHGDPLDPLGTYQGRRLQPRAIADLEALQAAMRADIGSSLTLTSAHRTPAHQRQLFRAQLTTSSVSLRGRIVTNNEIGLGLADDVLHHAMRRTAPPGFSRHHTGLTIDVAANGRGLFDFATTPAFDWLARDGYANAMAYGWIPSYPAGSTGLGPEPEPWEWAWVGRDLARCARAGSCVSGRLDALSPQAMGWAHTSDGSPPARLRLLTSEGTRALDPVGVTRFDVAAALGVDADHGFTAPVDLPADVRWACVEARSAPGGPWNAVGCMELR